MWNKLFRSRSATKIKESETENGCVVKNKTKLSSAFKSFRRKSKDRSQQHNNGDTVNDRLGDVYHKRSDTHDMPSLDYDIPIKPPPPPYPARLQSLPNGHTYVDDLPLPPPPLPNQSLQECPICARTFVPETLVKHIGICEKMASKKRKIFDSSKQRIEGTDLAAYVPKNYGQKPATVWCAIPQAPSQTAKNSQPKTITQRKSEPTLNDRRESSLTKSNHSLSRETPRPVRRVSAPTNEKCPYCERCFGIKAYERHVDWCKEKSLICKSTNNTPSAAKERQETRTKYRPPNMKAKRQTVRDKYGSLSCSGSTSSLADISTPPSAMTTSLTSDNGLFDRYDPFLSAKRQLEELYSPPSGSAGATSATKKSPSPIDPKIRSNSISTPMNMSMKRGEISNLSTARSSFRRSASLRMPNKMSKPLFAQAMKPTIQRGISDEGPISPNFLKSAEYDELPVRTAFNAIQPVRCSPPKEIYKPVLRDTRNVTNRKNSNLNIQSPVSQTPQYPISKTDSLAVFLKYETEIDVTAPPSMTPSPQKGPMTEKDLKDKSNILNKRSSMPKDNEDAEKYDVQKLPDINNLKPAISTNLDLVTVNSSLTPKIGVIKLDPINRNNKNTTMNLKNTLFERSNNDLSKKDVLDSYINPKLINLCDNLSINAAKLSSDSASDSSGCGQPKSRRSSQASSTRNLFDSPPEKDREEIEERPSSKSSHSSSEKEQIPVEINRELTPERPTSLYKTQNSIDRRSTLSRQRKLNKDNILFDTTPDSDFYSDNCDNAMSHVSSMESLNTKKFNDAESLFDDFDLEEFISTLEDDDRYPIFKDYKNILLSRALSTSSNTNTLLRSESYSSSKMESTTPQNRGPSPELRKSPVVQQQFSKEPTPDSENEHQQLVKNNNENNHSYQPDIDDLSPMERELLKSVQELDQMCESTSIMYPVDSDELSSIEGYPMTRQTVSKLSADSAYGSFIKDSISSYSLSRQSPTTERPTNNRNTNRSRQQQQQLHHPLFETQLPEPTRPQQQRQVSNRSAIRENTSLSSSGSESSLPPIMANLRAQKMELHPHSEKNASQTLSKFCHECGSKYVVTQAKFCMECGVRRVALE